MPMTMLETSSAVDPLVSALRVELERPSLRKKVRPTPKRLGKSWGVKAPISAYVSFVVDPEQGWEHYVKASVRFNATCEVDQSKCRRPTCYNFNTGIYGIRKCWHCMTEEDRIALRELYQIGH
jgi:hypothetical protein